MVVIPSVPFQPTPPVLQPILPQPLLAGGPIALMHRDLDARLKRAFPVEQFSHRTMPARLTREGWARFTERTPVVGLGWVKLTPVAQRSVRPRIWSGHAHWQLFLVVRNPRVEAQLLGDDLGAGMAGMLAVATAALMGHSIGGVGSAQIGEGGQTYSDDWADANLAQAALNISVPFDMVDLAGLAQLDDFLRLGQRWNGLPDLVSNVRDANAEDGRVAECA